MTYQQARDAATQAAHQALGGPCVLMAERVGTTYHSGRSDRTLFFRRGERIQPVAIYAGESPAEYTWEMGDSYERDR